MGIPGAISIHCLCNTFKWCYIKVLLYICVFTRMKDVSHNFGKIEKIV